MGKHKKKRGQKSQAEELDLAVTKSVEPWLDHPVARATGSVGGAADEPPLLTLSGIVLLAGLVRRDRKLARTGARMLTALTIAIGGKTFGKNNVDRSRPGELRSGDGYVMERGTSRDPGLRSFPSGHSAGAMAVARAAAREYPRLALPLHGAAGMMGVLQLLRRAHFPTDVLAGAAVGIAAEALTAVLFRKVGKHLAAAGENLPAAAVPL